MTDQRKVLQHLTKTAAIRRAITPTADGYGQGYADGYARTLADTATLSAEEAADIQAKAREEAQSLLSES